MPEVQPSVKADADVHKQIPPGGQQQAHVTPPRVLASETGRMANKEPLWHPGQPRGPCPSRLPVEELSLPFSPPSDCLRVFPSLESSPRRPDQCPQHLLCLLPFIEVWRRQLRGVKSEVLASDRPWAPVLAPIPVSCGAQDTCITRASVSPAGWRALGTLRDSDGRVL